MFCCLEKRSNNKLYNLEEEFKNIRWLLIYLFLRKCTSNYLFHKHKWKIYITYSILKLRIDEKIMGHFFFFLLSKIMGHVSQNKYLSIIDFFYFINSNDNHGKSSLMISLGNWISFVPFYFLRLDPFKFWLFPLEAIQSQKIMEYVSQNKIKF